MLDLRYYQRDAIDALYTYWREGGGNGLIVLPTGSGKALVIAKIIEELLADYPDMRIVNVTHDSRLVAQNFKEFIGISPFAPAGIYSAGLNRRDARAQVLFGGIQSIWNKVDQLGDIDLILIDEAHGISRNANTQYGKFFRAVKAANPDSRIAGTTATDYRMDSGRLTDDLDSDGEVDDDGNPLRMKMFDDVVYEIGLTELIEKGYLTRLTSQKTTAKIDLKGVGTRGGEYIPGQLSEAAERIIVDAVAEDMVLSEGRRAALFYATSKENAVRIRDEIRSHGRTCESLTSDNAHETDRIFEDFKAGKLWSIVSVGMLTTGTNFPFVDFISLILSTKSPGKLVQILGRGTRNCDGKDDCLIADHGKNLAYHGPIDQIRPKPPGSGDGEQPKKVCPSEETPNAKQDENGNWGCGEVIPISIMTCHCCGYVFPPSEEEKITATADVAPVLSTEKPWHTVRSRSFYFHEPKVAVNPPSVKVAYMVGLKIFNEWLCPQHLEHPEPKSRQFPVSKADRWWSQHGGKRPFPRTVMDWLDRQNELLATTEIQLDYSKNAKYPNIAAHHTGPANDNEPEADNDNYSPGMSEMMDDSIPF
ncbi:DEAD/DEAH box helicase family protein [Mesorhizobium sp. DCY119]|uniref:DEAD/DEAH box helicase n=1 Tax=Mesorhizobium sp. DCY119 TaxID=2108445 RepID=UPI000E6C7EE2|nr:DEAD/DEAH box helicase family protein [Mesorhizobium sp. DCY119]RJG46528.1 ATP-dependent helicase [Mesorhizobium sp. DCY119]